MDDLKHKTLTAREFQGELESQATYDLLRYSLVKSDQSKQHAILVVKGQQQQRHQTFSDLKTQDLRVLSTRSDLAAMLRDCLQHLEETPEHRVADALEKIEEHLQQISSSVQPSKGNEQRSEEGQS